MTQAPPQSSAGLHQSSTVGASHPNTPVGEICEPCMARYRIEAHYHDLWKTPIPLAPQRVAYADGTSITKGARTKALVTFGLQDGMNIDGVRQDVGSYEDRAPEAGSISAALILEAGPDPATLEREIIAELQEFAQTMETAMQSWISQWEADGWLGLFSSMCRGSRLGQPPGGKVKVNSGPPSVIGSKACRT